MSDELKFFSIKGYKLLFCMLYGGHFGPKNLMLKLHTFSCVFVILLLSVFLVLKSLVFLLLSLSFLFEFRLPPS